MSDFAHPIQIDYRLPDDTRIISNSGTQYQNRGDRPTHSTWGQSTTTYLFAGMPLGHVIAGTYICTLITDIPSEISDEFAAWDAVSDADFAAFEEGLKDDQ
jgi:hypothetical protein